jgi:hypothetical protein
MVPVSNEWKNAHNELLLPETFIELSYEITDPQLAVDANTSATNEESFSEAETITDATEKNPERYGTLEQNEWGLDGTYNYFDETPGDAGYTTSILSGADAKYTVVPTITISFAELQTTLIPGLTITWGEGIDEWAVSFRATVYNGNTQIARLSVTDNTSTMSQLFADLQNFNKIVIEIFEWCLPYRRCRVTEVLLGIRETYTKAELLGYTHTESADLLSAILPKNEITFSLDNSTGRWNPNNPTGVEKYLLERQKISVKYGMTVNGMLEKMKGGTFWLSEWNTPANGIEASFTARDAITFMNDVYTGPRSGTLKAIATAAFEQANLPVTPDGSARYFIDDNLANITTDFSEDTSTYTIADVLQMIAHMACCVFYQDRNGMVRIEPHNVEITDYVINRFRSYAHPEISISKPLRAVSVSYGENQNETLSVDAQGEVQTVSNSFIKTAADAQRVAKRTADVLKGRKTISGEFRADPRLSPLDVVTVESKYADSPVAITEIKYSTTGGAFKGTYTGRIVG